MSQQRLSHTYIVHETAETAHEIAESVAAGLLGPPSPISRAGVAPIASASTPSATAVGPLPMILADTPTNRLIPAVPTLRQTGSRRSNASRGLPAFLAASVALVLGLALGATALIPIQLASFAPPGPAANDVLSVGAGQAVPVEALSTLPTIVILSGGSAYDRTARADRGAGSRPGRIFRERLLVHSGRGRPNRAGCPDGCPAHTGTPRP